MFRSEGSDVRIVAFRVDSGESVLSIHHGANVGQDDDQHVDVP